VNLLLRAKLSIQLFKKKQNQKQKELCMNKSVNRFLGVFLSLLIMSVSVLGQDIILPKVVLPPGPTPTPTVVVVEPTEITELSADTLYVIESTNKFFVLDSERGIVTTNMETGPIKVRGKFVDGNGKYETRNYVGPYICIVEALKKGRVELLAVPVGAEDANVVVRTTLNVMGMSPNPPPTPDPTPDPEPTPNPIPGDKNRVLIMYEASDLSSMPVGQTVQLTSANLRSYLNKKCLKGADGKTAEYRIWDKDVDLTNVSQVWKDAIGTAKKENTTLPVLAVSNGKSGWIGTLPATEAETLSILKKYLGE
jgi:hypothetical protein